MAARILLLISCLLAAPRQPIFVCELWPEEGRPIFTAKGGLIELHRAPSADAPVSVRFMAISGDSMPFDSTEYQTFSPGRLVALRDGAIEGRSLAKRSRLSKSDYYDDESPDRTIGYQTGDTIEYLQYRAEGFGFIRAHGEVLEVKLWRELDSLDFQPLSWPVTEWWIRVAGSPEGAGWLLVDSTQVVEADRVLN